MMTRLVPRLGLALVLTISGCAAEPAVVKPSPSPSAVEPSPTPSPSPIPSPTPTPSPTPKPTTKPPKPPNPTKPPHTEPPPRTVRMTGSQAVALTFDDGPDPVNTPKILDVLKEHGVKATFCVNGVKVQMYPNLIRRIHAEGHSFCNHTWRHIRQLGSYGTARIKQDLSDTNNAIRAAVPGAKIGYFRAPGGVWTHDYVKVCNEMGMTPTGWDVDTRDWEFSKYGRGQSMVDHIVSSLKNDTRPGSIVLMHDYQKPDTTAALRVALPWLKARFTLIALPADGIPLP